MDYIKVIVDPPGRGGPDQATVAAIVQAAHDAGRIVVAHASNTGAVAMAQAAGADVLTHAPLDAALDEAAVAEVVRSQRTSVPTLVMMEGVAANAPVPGLDYRHARDSVAALHRAGVPIVLGHGRVITSRRPLAAVFTVLGVLPVTVVTQIGIIVGLGVLPDTLLVRTVLVAAIVQFLNNGFWAPGQLEQITSKEGHRTRHHRGEPEFGEGRAACVPTIYQGRR